MPQVSPGMESVPASSLPEWRNWYTHWTQNPAVATPCRFESDLRHHLNQHLRSAVRPWIAPCPPQRDQEVKFLEGLKSVSSTQAASAFKREPLKGLMKKHFTDARFIVKNLGAHFGYDHGGNKDLDALISEAFSRNESCYVDETFINFIAHESTVGALQKRAKNKKISGEWIVFQKYNGKNYYLTLAAHDEGDECVYGRVCDAYDLDFEFLRKNA